MKIAPSAEAVDERALALGGTASEETSSGDETEISSAWLNALSRSQTSTRAKAVESDATDSDLESESEAEDPTELEGGDGADVDTAPLVKTTEQVIRNAMGWFRIRSEAAANSARESETESVSTSTKARDASVVDADSMVSADRTAPESYPRFRTIDAASAQTADTKTRNGAQSMDAELESAPRIELESTTAPRVEGESEQANSGAPREPARTAAPTLPAQTKTSSNAVLTLASTPMQAEEAVSSAGRVQETPEVETERRTADTSVAPSEDGRQSPVAVRAIRDGLDTDAEHEAESEARAESDGEAESSSDTERSSSTGRGSTRASGTERTQTASATDFRAAASNALNSSSGAPSRPGAAVQEPSTPLTDPALLRQLHDADTHWWVETGAPLQGIVKEATVHVNDARLGDLSVFVRSDHGAVDLEMQSPVLATTIALRSSESALRASFSASGRELRNMRVITKRGKRVDEESS